MLLELNSPPCKGQFLVLSSINGRQRKDYVTPKIPNRFSRSGVCLCLLAPRSWKATYTGWAGVNLSNRAVLPLLLAGHTFKTLSWWCVPSRYPDRTQVPTRIAQHGDPFIRRIFLCIVFVFWFSVFPFLRKLNSMFHLKALNKDCLYTPWLSLFFFFLANELVRSSVAWCSHRFSVLWTGGLVLPALPQLLAHRLLPIPCSGGFWTQVVSGPSCCARGGISG